MQIRYIWKLQTHLVYYSLRKPIICLEFYFFEGKKRYGGSMEDKGSNSGQMNYTSRFDFEDIISKLATFIFCNFIE